MAESSKKGGSLRLIARMTAFMRCAGARSGDWQKKVAYYDLDIYHCQRLLCATTNGSTPEPIDYYWGRPLRANVMPFQEDRGAEDVPNLLSARIRGPYSMDGTADTFFFSPLLYFFSLILD